jgi:hypothetical protein
MKTLILALGVMVASSNGAWARQDGADSHRNMREMMQNCPMKLPNVKMSLEDTLDGIAITMTTESGNVDVLRRRIEHLAAMRNNSDGGRGMMRNRVVGTAKYEPVPNGAKLTLTPRDPAQLESFRKRVRAHAECMQNGDCSMMQEMMRGMDRPDASGEEDSHEFHHSPRN